MTVPSSPPPASRRRAVRIAVVAGAIVAVLVVVLLVFLPPLRRSARIGALSPAEDVGFREMVGDDDPELNAELAEALRDGSRTYRNRVGIAKMLLRRQPAAVETAVRSGDLDTRVVALSALLTHSSFVPQFVRNPSYRVRETVLEWLRRDGDGTRSTALVIAQMPDVRSAEVLAAIRRLLASDVPAKQRREAIDALKNYVDCESAAEIDRIARSDPEPETRLRAMQALGSFLRAKGSPCAAVVSVEKVGEVVASALAHPGEEKEDRALRQGAMIEMALTPALAEGKVAALRARLDPKVHGAERRQALETLAAVRDPEAIASLPRFAHDPEAGVRSSVVQIVTRLKDPAEARRNVALLVGYVRDEPSSSALGVFQAALNRLRNEADSYVGFPTKYSQVGGPGLVDFVKRLFQGEADGATRASVAEAWFRHLAKREGLDDAGIAAAVAVREAFWAKARADDVAGAKAALDGSPLPAAHPDLFRYETGWLASKS
jgi:HEAT repeat protein